LENVPVFEAHSSENQFALLAWFKLEKYPWDSSVQQDMNIFQIEEKLRCLITKNKRIDCQSGRYWTSGTSSSGSVFRLQVTEEQLFLDQWYLLVCQSKKGNSVLSVYHQTF